MIFYILQPTGLEPMGTHAHHQQTVVVASWGEKKRFWARIFSVYNMHITGNLRANSLSAASIFFCPFCPSSATNSKY